MTDVTALKPARAKLAFLSENDLVTIRNMADEIEAVFGASLLSLMPLSLAKLAEKSRAA